MDSHWNEVRWYAVHTRAKHENSVGLQLQRRGVDTFVPCVREVHRWSDRSKVVEAPLFSCYVFVHGSLSQAHKSVIHTPGVIRWVAVRGEPAFIPDNQIEAVRSIVNTHVPVWPHAFLSVGQRVRIRGGCLDGVEGTLVEQKGDRKLVVSIDLIQHSLATTIDGYDVEAV